MPTPATDLPGADAPGLGDADRPAMIELAPLLRRVDSLDPQSFVRLRFGAGTAAAFVRVPFGVLVSRSVRTAAEREPSRDLVVRVADTVDWLDKDQAPAPVTQDGAWVGSMPPATGWTRIETVPDDLVRGLVRQGALALKAGAERAGVPGAQPRAAAADALLDSVVLTVRGGDERADDQPTDVDLRTLSALTRMGFLPRGGSAHVDVAGRWVRVAAGYGTVYRERPGGLTVLHPRR